MKVLRIILQSKYYLLIFFIVFLLIALIRVNYFHSKYNMDEHNFILMVEEKKKKDDYYYVVFRGKELLIGYYETFPYDIGDILEIKASLSKIKEKTIPNVFSYKKYLQSRGIYYNLNISEISLKKANNNPFKWIKQKIANRINVQDKNKEYLYAFILGDTSYFSDNQREILSKNGVVFLLSIGSFQVYFLLGILKKIKKVLRIKFQYYYVLMFIIIVIYIYLTTYKIGILRNGLFCLIIELLEYKRIRYKKHNILLFLAGMFLLINPLFVNNISFWYSFIISIGNSLIKRGKRNYFRRSFISFLLSVPLLIFNNYEVNFLSIIINMFLFPFVNYILFPLSIVALIIPKGSFIMNFFLLLFEKINLFFYNMPFALAIFRKPSIIVIIIYYMVILLVLRKKKLIIFLIALLIFHNNINYLIKENIVTFLDVGQGDSILLKNNQSAILIDTGGTIYSNYSINIINYLKSLGIKKVDFLILSHGDYDHMGEAVNFINDFNIKNVIFNCGIFNDLENGFIKELDKKKIPYFSCIKELSVQNNKLYFLQTKEYDNENDNSNVIYTEINDYKFMFMGDAGITKEKDLIEKYNINNIDVLKVGHHGSKTSSSQDFINKVNPKYSIISVGNNNSYGHPNKEVLDVLKNTIIYRTDKDGSIEFKIKKNKLEINTFTT